MQKLTFVLLTMIIGFLSFGDTHAQKTKYQSVFIYNFSKYIKWPDDFNNGKFVIGVLGESEILADMKSMVAAKKETNGLEMEIRTFSSLVELTECNLLFVASDFCPQIRQIQDAISLQPTLIVTDNPGMATKGATINFVEQDSKIKFQLNQKNAKSKGLKVAGSLTSLAILL